MRAAALFGRGRPTQEEEARGRLDARLSKAGRAQGGLQLSGLVVDLGDRELAAVVQPTQRLVVFGHRMVCCAGLGIAPRIDEAQEPTGLQPVATDPQEICEAVARHVAQPEATEERVNFALGWRPGVADVDMR